MILRPGCVLSPLKRYTICMYLLNSRCNCFLLPISHFDNIYVLLFIRRRSAYLPVSTRAVGTIAISNILPYSLTVTKPSPLINFTSVVIVYVSWFYTVSSQFSEHSFESGILAPQLRYMCHLRRQCPVNGPLSCSVTSICLNFRSTREHVLREMKIEASLQLPRTRRSDTVGHICYLVSSPSYLYRPLSNE